MSFRDPDLGRDRKTRFLGQRDYGFFVHTDAGILPAERQPAAAPWGDGREVGLHDRYDRTLGIPDRYTPMWPSAPLMLQALAADPTARAEAVCDAIYARPLPTWRWPEPAVAVALLTEVAADLYDRHPTQQAAVLARAAGRHGVAPKVATELASGVGALAAQTTHRRLAPANGSPSLNALASTRIGPTTELFYARDRLRLAKRLSDPDLPRLWMLANGLAHGVAPDIMLRVPARSVGPLADAFARLRAERQARGEQPLPRHPLEVHDDLVGWDGMGKAVEHLRHVVRAADEGRRWLDGVQLTTMADRVLAVGVVALTRPAAATELAQCGVGGLGVGELREAAGPGPSGVLDLSDAALKGVCDRNGWLLGAATERTQRELAERNLPEGEHEVLRGLLADGDPEVLAVLAAWAPGDGALDAGAFRKNPPDRDAVAAHQLLAEGGREALRRFAGIDPPQRSSLAEAMAHRFPERRSQDVLSEHDAGRLLMPELPARRPAASVPLTLDLGI